MEGVEEVGYVFCAFLIIKQIDAGLVLDLGEIIGGYGG